MTKLKTRRKTKRITVSFLTLSFIDEPEIENNADDGSFNFGNVKLGKRKGRSNLKVEEEQ